MKYASLLALGLVLSVGATPALAQMSPGGMGMGGAGGSPAPAPQAPTSSPAPAGIPGLAGGEPGGVPPTHKAVSGDPTKALFDAVNKGDDSAAQDAVARGADLNAQDQFGETPLDLAVALNRTSIIFLLLDARNEQGNAGTVPQGSTWSLAGVKPKLEKAAPKHHVYHRQSEGHTGTPDPQAGFLGFGPNN